SVQADASRYPKEMHMSNRTSRSNTNHDHFLAHAEEFYEVVGRAPRFYNVIETNAHEGPVYVRDEQALYFTTTPVSSNIPIAGSKEVAIRRISLKSKKFPLDAKAATTVRAVSNMATGMTLDAERRSAVCEQGT